jgi:murein DD-endopeptidase MepM/ murein hydrolase activator NlpD
VKKLKCGLIFGIFLIWSCDTPKPSADNPFYIYREYGAPVYYGEGCNPGIDFEVSQGTPIIAATDGEVSFVGDSDPEVSYSGGIFVRVQNAQHFDLIYRHLSKVYVKKGQSLKRGQLIGLSGASNDGVHHLHFGICKVGGNSQKYSQTYDPEKFWLDGRPKCFDPGADYSKYSYKGITIPIACRSYAKELIAAAEK